MWNIAPGDGDPCAAAEKQQVRCYRTGNATLALIRQLDRPGRADAARRGQPPCLRNDQRTVERHATLTHRRRRPDGPARRAGRLLARRVLRLSGGAAELRGHDRRQPLRVPPLNGSRSSSRPRWATPAPVGPRARRRQAAKLDPSLPARAGAAVGRQRRTDHADAAQSRERRGRAAPAERDLVSLILDALRKADAERERGSVPSLHSQPVVSPSAGTLRRRQGASELAVDRDRCRTRPGGGRDSGDGRARCDSPESFEPEPGAAERAVPRRRGRHRRAFHHPVAAAAPSWRRTDATPPLAPTRRRSRSPRPGVRPSRAHGPAR